MSKLMKTCSLSLIFLVTITALIITFNFSSFMEGFYNGFYEMQTTPETIASFFGNLTFDLINWRL